MPVVAAQPRASDRSIDSGSTDDSQGIVTIGLAIGAGLLALVVLGLLAVLLWRCKKDARSAGETPAQPQQFDVRYLDTV